MYPFPFTVVRSSYSGLFYMKTLWYFIRSTSCETHHHARAIFLPPPPLRFFYPPNSRYYPQRSQTPSCLPLQREIMIHFHFTSMRLLNKYRALERIHSVRPDFLCLGTNIWCKLGYVLDMHGFRGARIMLIVLQYLCKQFTERHTCISASFLRPSRVKISSKQSYVQTVLH
jgi:hypothetical protein